MHNWPNQPLEPMARSVTPRACARVAPALAMAHHQTLGIVVARTQLSLFVSEPTLNRLEHIRQLVDPTQAALIPAHVTLCRDEEVQFLSPSLIGSRLETQPPILIEFRTVEQVDGHGLILRITDSQDGFQRLRRCVLGPDAKRSDAHITLAHPRNPKVNGNRLGAVDIALPVSVLFDKAVLIVQDTMDTPWRITYEFRFGGRFHA